jgi:predicted small secreted protein
MNIKIKLFVGVIAVVLSTSTGLAASNASAQSGENV